MMLFKIKQTLISLVSIECFRTENSNNNSTTSIQKSEHKTPYPFTFETRIVISISCFTSRLLILKVS